MIWCPIIHDPPDHRHLETRSADNVRYLQLLADGICTTPGTYLSMLPPDLVNELRKMRGDLSRWTLEAGPALSYESAVPNDVDQYSHGRMETFVMSKPICRTEQYKTLIQRMLHRHKCDYRVVVDESKDALTTISYVSLAYDDMHDELIVRHCRQLNTYPPSYTLHLPLTDDLISVLDRASQ